MPRIPPTAEPEDTHAHTRPRGDRRVRRLPRRHHRPALHPRRGRPLPAVPPLPPRTARPANGGRLMPRPAQEPARDAREAIRELNHATIVNGGYTWPSDVDATVAALHELVASLPQAFRQASRWLATAHEAG